MWEVIVEEKQVMMKVKWNMNVRAGTYIHTTPTKKVTIEHPRQVTLIPKQFKLILLQLS